MLVGDASLKTGGQLPRAYDVAPCSVLALLVLFCFLAFAPSTLDDVSRDSK